MMKTIMLGLWVGIVVAGSAIGAGFYAMRPEPASLEARLETEYRKLASISVPKVADGALQGYIVARIGLTVDSKLAKEQQIAPEIFMFQDAFRILYSDQKLDFRHLDTYDIDGFTKQLLKNANERMKADVVKNVAIEDLNFFTIAEVNK